MRRLFLLCLVIIFGANCIVFAQQKTGQKIEGKKLQVDAVTSATPRPQESQVVITGTLICTSCDLKEQKGVKSQCNVYGCSYSIKTKKVINPKGQSVKEQVGKIYNILANDNSSILLKKEYKGKDVIIVGKIYSDENVIEVDFVKIRPPYYVCPTCDAEFGKPGKCPKCNMDLIEKKEEHKH